MNYESVWKAQINVRLLFLTSGAIALTLGLVYVVVQQAVRLLHVGWVESFEAVLGMYIILVTWRRPAWFWNDLKASWFRDVIGDTATTALCTIVGLVIAGLGAGRQWQLHAARQRCEQALSAATDSHARFEILYYQGVDGLLPALVRLPSSFTCEQLRHSIP